MSISSQTDEKLDEVFFALSDHRRRRVLERLSAGPLIKKELGKEFAMSKPAVGKHIRILENSGLIKTTEKGRTHQCELNPAALEDLSQWLERYQRYWKQSLKSLSDYARQVKKDS